ncbi:ATP-binding protein [Halarcobacter sp.]|uniref:PAS domain-containing sensor histidine kinase n=1 Tax=Halarcobacter sp. TaxID=2321133 RepID=UPI002AA8FBBC|nr:ATP-binding protein [Halarcobacter sp.]
MSDFKIKEITFYSFLYLIIGLLITSVILYFSLTKIRNLNEQLSKLTLLQNSFLKMKVNSENLLITTDITNNKQIWLESVYNFNNDLKRYSFLNKHKIERLWYPTIKEINEIKDILSNQLLSTYNLQGKPILTLKGELFISENETEKFNIINQLIKKIIFLTQYENLIFKEFKRVEKNEKKYIDEQIKSTLYYSLFFIIFTILSILGVIGILNKKINRIEIELLKSQNNLEKNILEIKESKLLLQKIIDSVPAAIFWKDTKNRYLGVNKYILNNAGLNTPSDMIGKTDYEMPWEKEQAKNFIDDDNKIMKEGKEKLQIEEKLTQKDGNTINVITSKVPLRNSKNEVIGVLGIFMDITEKINLEDSLNRKDKLLTQQSKMASLGEMLENIAHQWRQPLSLILSTSTGIKIKKEYNQLNDEFLTVSIENIIHSVEHLNQTINDFRDYLKPDKKQRYFNIEKVIDKALILLQSRIKNNLLEIDKNMGCIDAYGYKNEFVQVLMNIINNSIDELEKKDIKDKIIRIETKELEKCETLVSDDVCKYKCAQIKISDNAGGIAQDIINDIFNIYFTTKGEKGTGIGLYMSKEMIEEHMNGSIKVSNEKINYKGKIYNGATFTITIPSQKYD